MADLRIGTATSAPAAGTLKLGSTDISKIYSGSTLVWPIEDDPSADVCGIEFTTVNTSITAVTSGSTIVIATSASDWALKINQGIAAAAYYNYDIANASRGLYYNIYAFAVIQPPAGFRKPLQTDITTLLSSSCVDTSVSPSNVNSLGTSVGTGGWNESLFTNTTNRGNSGLDIGGYGHLATNPNLSGTFVKNGELGGFWFFSSGNSYAIVIGDNGTGAAYFSDPGLLSTSTAGFNIRFCKDIP